jgi:sporadic carbohydrate cluster 2OG-Fe(II) oxygenase
MDNQWELTFYQQGYIIIPCENMSSLAALRQAVEEATKQSTLSLMHEYVTAAEINDVRLRAFRKINGLDRWDSIYKSIAATYIKTLLGPDLAIQSKLNLSIQMPYDATSLLQLHTDALSGQSPFEIVLWVPLTKCHDTNSMYIFSKKCSSEMLQRLQNHEHTGMLPLFDEYRSEAKYIDINYGECLIFSPTLFHGNTLNETSFTRVSINCRFKNIFSPEADSGERRLGSFYRILELSPVARLGLDYKDEDIRF